MEFRGNKAKSFLSLLSLFLLSACSLALFAADCSAAVFNVTNLAGFRNALERVRVNRQNDTINLAPGIYGPGGGTRVLFYNAAFGELEENFTLTINGAGAGATILDGGGRAQVMHIITAFLSDDSNAHVTVRNLTVRNGNVNNEFGGAGLFIATNSANITIENCSFNNNSFNTSSQSARGGGASAVALSGGNVTLANNTFTNNSAVSSFSSGGAVGGGATAQSQTGILRLTNNKFINNSVSGVLGVGGGGLFVGPLNSQPSISADVIYTNNVFINNSINASGAPRNALGGGSCAGTLGDMTLTNNTFTLNSTSGAGGGFAVVDAADSTVVNFYNNIVFGNNAAGNGDDIFMADDFNNNNIGATVNLFNNDFSSFFSACANTASCVETINRGGNIFQAPLFVNAGNGNIRLQSGSPAIDRGSPSAPALPATDFEGNPRIVGSGPDIGADEFVSSVSAVCDGLTATIVGTAGNDSIVGTVGPDVINGLGGNDTISGLGGGDVICGGDGDDTINGDDGNDRLLGGNGNDTLNGGNGNDTLDGNAGSDTFNGGNNNDTLNGGFGNDIINGNSGSDRLNGNENNDALDGGVGTDVCDGGIQTDTAVNCETRIGIP